MEKTSERLKKAKNFGLVGMVLPIFSFITPYFSLILVIVSIILLIIVIKEISETVKKKEILKDYIKYVILAIISLFIFIGALIAGLTQMLFEQVWLTPENEKLKLADWIIIWIVGLLISWILYIFGIYFLKRSFSLISEETKVQYFSWAGKFLFIGAILRIILVGFILEIVSWILAIIAFLSLPEKLPEK